MKTMTCTLTILLLGALTLAAPAQTVPPLINYQGRLANPDGSPLPTGDYELRFRIYDAATNGTLIWGPQLFDAGVGAGHGPKIPVVQGYFNVMLGPVDTNGASLAGAFNASNRFVEVTVSNRPPIAPRQQVLSAPFALMAASVADGSVTLAKLAPRQTLTNTVGVGGVAVSLQCESATTSSTTYVDVTNLIVTITTLGRPVHIMLMNDSSTNMSWGIFGAGGTPANGMGCAVTVIVDGSRSLGETATQVGGANATFGTLNVPVSSVQFLDFFATAGQHTYKVQFKLTSSGAANISAVRLVAYEL